MSLKVDYPMIDTFPHGAPLGGFGAGTFSRSPAGDFSIWHLFNGVHIQQALPGCNFAIYQKKGNKKHCYALNYNGQTVLPAWQPMPHKKKSNYCALYPKSWYCYNSLPARLKIEQFSPILPHNYKETSYPAACFRINVNNPTKEEIDISFLVSWENFIGYSYLSGEKTQVTGFSWQKNKIKRENKRIEEYEIKGLLLSGEVPESRKDWLSGQICLATKEIEGTKVYFRTTYDGEGSGEEIWEQFSSNGTLKDSLRPEIIQPYAALAIKTTLNPGQTMEIPLVIVWDIPFCNNKKTAKYYTKYFNANGTNAFTLAKEVLNNFYLYSQKIDSWQQEYLKNKNIPHWLTGMLFNELYYYADGGTIWDAATGNFGLLECFDYYFYETLDVRFYGTFGLAQFWPEIEKNIIKYFAGTVFAENRTLIDYHKTLTASTAGLGGTRQNQFIQQDQRKKKYALPHDLGSPFEDVFEKLNAYTWQNANRWKDLNSKFILLIYRAYYYSGKKDQQFLANCWPALWEALHYLDGALDTDNDYLPENEAFPDQTFDNWVMRGTSAYCGILRLASLQAAIQIAYLLDKKEEGQQLRGMLKKAKDSLETKLWNGKYYNFDQKSNDLMTAQLVGQWYLDQLHLPGIISEDHIHYVLKNIYNLNFKKFCGGKKGLVNGRTSDGKPVSCSQGNDVWTGINYAFAAHLFKYGYKKEAFAILHAVIKTIKQYGFLFRTPESWDAENKFIGSMYMRPGAIWAIPQVINELDK
jgi:non-lysosomal glucosylceramidase